MNVRRTDMLESIVQGGHATGEMAVSALWAVPTTDKVALKSNISKWPTTALSSTFLTEMLLIVCSGVWGTVCNNQHSFSDSAAKVVCVQMGLVQAVPNVRDSSSYTQGNSTIWLDNVQCSGDERYLADV